MYGKNCPYLIDTKYSSNMNTTNQRTFTTNEPQMKLFGRNRSRRNIFMEPSIGNTENAATAVSTNEVKKPAEPDESGKEQEPQERDFSVEERTQYVYSSDSDQRDCFDIIPCIILSDDQTSNIEPLNTDTTGDELHHEDNSFSDSNNVPRHKRDLYLQNVESDGVEQCTEPHNIISNLIADKNFKTTTGSSEYATSDSDIEKDIETIRIDDSHQSSVTDGNLIQLRARCASQLSPTHPSQLDDRNAALVADGLYIGTNTAVTNQALLCRLQITAIVEIDGDDEDKTIREIGLYDCPTIGKDENGAIPQNGECTTEFLENGEDLDDIKGVVIREKTSRRPSSSLTSPHRLIMFPCTCSQATYHNQTRLSISLTDISSVDTSSTAVALLQHANTINRFINSHRSRQRLRPGTVLVHDRSQSTHLGAAIVLQHLVLEDHFSLSAARERMARCWPTARFKLDLLQQLKLLEKEQLLESVERFGNSNDESKNTKNKDLSPTNEFKFRSVKQAW